jgi:hypothetical protein
MRRRPPARLPECPSRFAPHDADVDKLLLACLLLALQGLALLGVLAHAVHPGPVPLSNLARFEGQRVCVEATLASLRPQGDSTRFVLQDEGASLHGTARFPWTAVPGDDVRACGSLRRTGATLSLYPDRASDLRILRAWDTDLVPLPELAQRPWDHAGRHLATVGVVAKDGARYYLADAVTNARLRLVSADPTPEGERVRAEGVLEYDAKENQFRLRLTAARAVP